MSLTLTPYWFNNHALVCFTCPCDCLHPLQVSLTIPGVFIPVFPVSLCQIVLFVNQRFCVSAPAFPSLSFLALLVLTLACPDSEPACLAILPDPEPACRPVPLPHLWIINLCLP